MMNKNSILQIDSSSRFQGSVTRRLSEIVTQHLSALPSATATSMIKRDLSSGLPFIDERWIGANFTAPEDRTDEHKAVLSFSDQLVGELQQAEHIVIGVPIYNFSIPAVLKAWVDLIARAKLTFKYGENGPEGLLKNKRAYLVMASGGVPIGSEMEFASGYLKHVLAFVGITDVTIIDAAKIDLSASSKAIGESLKAQIKQPASV